MFLGLDHDAVRMKLSGIGVKVVFSEPGNTRTTTSIQVMLKEIITHEEALCRLASALKTLKHRD